MGYLLPFLVGLAISIALAFIPCNIASKKGYNGLIFFVFAAVCFIPALVVSECIKDKYLYEDNLRAELLINYHRLNKAGVISDEEFKEKADEILFEMDLYNNND